MVYCPHESSMRVLIKMTANEMWRAMVANDLGRQDSKSIITSQQKAASSTFHTFSSTSLDQRATHTV